MTGSRAHEPAPPPIRSRIVLRSTLALLLLAASAVVEAQGRFRLPGLRGGALTSAELDRGTHVLLVWASWSPRCRDIVERANAVADRWGSRATVSTIVFQEDAAAVEKFLRGQSLRPPTYLDSDGEFSKAHAVTTLPGLVVLRDGEVRFQGRLPADPDAAITDALR